MRAAKLMQATAKHSVEPLVESNMAETLRGANFTFLKDGRMRP